MSEVQHFTPPVGHTTSAGHPAFQCETAAGERIIFVPRIDMQGKREGAHLIYQLHSGQNTGEPAWISGSNILLHGSEVRRMIAALIPLIPKRDRSIAATALRALVDVLTNEVPDGD